jgi:sugar lactone lactonase YvrE
MFPSRVLPFALSACVAGAICLAPLAVASVRGGAFAPGAPIGIALDSTGALYVVRAGDSVIAVFAPGAEGRAAPLRTIRGSRTGLLDLRGIALDTRGRIYTSNGPRRRPGQGSVTVYAPTAKGNASPIRTIAGPRTSLVRPTGLALDPAGRVWVTNRSASGPVRFDIHADGDVEPEQRMDLGPGPTMLTQTTDIAFGEDGSLLALDATGVTAHLVGGSSRRYTTARESSDVSALDFSPHPIRVTAGRGGEVLIAGMLADTTPRTSEIDSIVKGFGPRIDSMFRRFFGRQRARPAVVTYGPPGIGDTAPVRMIVGAKADLGVIRDMAVGADGSLYVLGLVGPGDGTQPRIAIYAPKADGEVPPARVIRGPRTELVNPNGIAVDRAGRIYVTNSGVATDTSLPSPAITVYSPRAMGDAAPVRTITGPATGLGGPGSLAVAEDGTLFVANSETLAEDLGSITIHAAGAEGDQPPLGRLVGPGIASPGTLAVGPGDTLYAVIKGRINVYPPHATGGTLPLRAANILLSWRATVRGIVVDTTGQLYVADPINASGINAYGPDLGAIRVFGSGGSTPFRSINGSMTRLNGPAGVDVDRSGNIYVANYWGTGSGSVTVYASWTGEDVRPLRMIAGPATGLKSPSAIALDRQDTLYVANAATITVYAPGAAGDVEPVRTIELP